jgi:LysR family transcriptional regulator, regulator of abg operon
VTIKLHHLHHLLAVVEKGSINAAARQLGVAQPALSRSIRDLENDLGVPLLERRAHGAVLTSMGQVFVRRAAAAVSELRRARDEIDQLQGEVHGAVVACLSSSVHVMLLPDAIKPFHKRYPDVLLHLIEGVYPVVEQKLKNGEIDFYLGPAPDGGPARELQLEKVFDNSRVVLARKGHPRAQAKSLSELTDVKWVSTSIMSHEENEVGDAFARYNLPIPRIGLRAESALTWIIAVAHGDVMSMSPPHWLSSPLVRELIQRVPIKEELSAKPLVLIRRAAVPLTPAAEHLCDLLKRAAAREAPHDHKLLPRPKLARRTKAL